MSKSAWGDDQTRFFYEITPEVVLKTVEAFGIRTTGRVLTLNSLENRVYEVELDLEEVAHPWDKFRVIKFYRPGRWTKEQIEEEHQFIAELKESDIPVVAPINLNGSGTVLTVTESSIYAAVFPKVGGRIPEELTDEQLLQVGRLIARMHITAAQSEAKHRLVLNPDTYALANLEYLLTSGHLPKEITPQYERLVVALCKVSAPLFKQFPQQRVHGDLHPGNLLWGSMGIFIVDFDDMVRAPAVQDIWLLTAGRDKESLIQRDLLLEGYEQMRSFDRESLVLVEPLRTLRLIHYSAWIARRFEDPAFKRAFGHFGTAAYWNEQVGDLTDQLALLEQ